MLNVKNVEIIIFFLQILSPPSYTCTTPKKKDETYSNQS